MKADIQIKNGKQMAKILRDIVNRSHSRISYCYGVPSYEKTVISYKESLETLIKVLESNL